MNTQSSNTAILIFARSARKEANLKQWNKDQSLAVEFSKFLNNKVEVLTKKSSLPYFWFDETRQHGNNFGVRLSNAVTDVFDKGFEHVIIIGNDCPELKAEDLIGAKKTLESGHNVLGPDLRNGVYLIGLSRDSFDPQTFEGIRWQSKSTFEDLQNLLPAVTLLHQKADLNKKSDVATLQKTSLSQGALLFIRRCLGYYMEVISAFKALAIQTAASGHRSLRAPPLSI